MKKLRFSVESLSLNTRRNDITLQSRTTSNLNHLRTKNRNPSDYKDMTDDRISKHGPQWDFTSGSIGRSQKMLTQMGVDKPQSQTTKNAEMGKSSFFPEGESVSLAAMSYKRDQLE